jgi:hypothetical protein
MSTGQNLIVLMNDEENLRTALKNLRAQGYENSALNPYFCNNLDDLIKSSKLLQK